MGSQTWITPWHAERRPGVTAAAMASCKETRMEDPGGGGGTSVGTSMGLSSAKASSDLSVPGPIFFLIKEQAKSLLAIKELQDRVQALEGFRNDIFYAIQDIQQTMHYPARQSQLKVPPDDVPVRSASVPSGEGCVSPNSSNFKSWTLNPKPRRHKDTVVTPCARTKVKDGSTCKLSSRSTLKPPATSLSSQAASTSTKGDPTSTILESDKQDSGLDSDCREHGSQESILAPKDELLLLLEMIDERGVQLQEKVQEMEQAQASMGQGRDCAPRSHSELLEFHRKELQARLSEMEVERENYRTMVRQLQSTIHRLEGEKVAYEHKLQATLVEKKQLERKVHSLHLQYVRGEPSSVPPLKAESWPLAHCQDAQSLSGLERLRREVKGIKSEEGKAKVSAILRESNPIELKKLLLLYTLENQSLQDKAEKKDQKWYSDLSEWKTTEASLRTDIQNLIQERDEYVEALRRHQTEMRTLQAKYKVLEMTVLAFNTFERGDNCHGEQCCASPSPYAPNQRLARSYHSELAYGEPCYRTQSLPPVLLTQAENGPLLRCQNATALHCAGNSLAENSFEETAFNNEGMAYELEDQGHERPLSFTDSPLSSPKKLFRPLWQHRHTGPSGTVSDAVRLMNLDEEHRELKSGPQSDIDMICSEFDPLVKLEVPAARDRDPNTKPLDFVDSLDLSIPLKPTKTGMLSATRPTRACLELKYLPTPIYSARPVVNQKQRTFSKSSD